MASEKLRDHPLSGERSESSFDGVKEEPRSSKNFSSGGWLDEYGNDFRESSSSDDDGLEFNTDEENCAAAINEDEDDDDFNDPELDDDFKDIGECKVCACKFFPSTTVCCSKDHRWCMECVNKHVKNIVHDVGTSTVKCMEIGCDGEFPREILSHVLDTELFKTLEGTRLSEQLSCAGMSGYKLLKCGFCKRFTMVFNVVASESNTFQCSNTACGKECCRYCKREAKSHPKNWCSALETADVMEIRQQAEERMTEVMVRRCKKCDVALVKESGCNILRCRCGSKICYICRQEVSGHSHFARNEMCKLYDDTTSADTRVVKQIKYDSEAAAFQTAHRKVRIGVDTKLLDSPVSKKAHRGFLFDAVPYTLWISGILMCVILAIFLGSFHEYIARFF